jgi:MFS transporter, DHA1 family, multidrug resistance protein
MNTNRSLLILILGLLSAIGPFSIDTYISGFPSIAADFHVTVDTVSYSLSSFFIGISIGQIICGPLLDRFGRKKPLMIGLVIYALASFGCAVTQSIEMLIVLRFIQALGGCVGMVAPRAIVRDMFPIHEIAKIFSLLILILGVSPIIAPTIGSYFILSFGWQSVFVLQGIMGILLLLAVIFYLPESKEADTTMSLKPRPIITGFLNVLKEPQFYTYAFTGAVVSASIYAYLAGSPSVFMQQYGISETTYSYCFGFIAAGLIISSQINRQLLKRISSIQIVKTVIRIQLVIGIVLFIGSFLGWLNFFSMVTLIFFFISCQGFCLPNTTALSLMPFTKEAGSASALLGALQMGFGALAAALVGSFGNGTSVPMTLVMAGFAFLGLAIFIVGNRYLKHNLNFENEEISLEVNEL